MLLSFETALFFSDRLSLCASVASISVLVLMFFKPPKSLGNYRYCYYLLSTLECTSAISHFFGGQSFFIDGNTYLAFAVHGSLITHVIWIFAYHSFEVWLTACFLYRYATVCRNKYFTAILETKWSFTVAIALTFALPVMVTVNFYMLFMPNEALNIKAAQLLSKLIPGYNEDNFVAGFDHQIGHRFLSSSTVRFACLLASVVTISQMAIIIACALLIINYVKQNEYSTSQTKRHHRVLIYLVLQTIVPFCFVYSLALGCQLAISIRLDLSFLAPVMTLTTSIPPLIGAISVLGLTSEYRQMFAHAIESELSTAKALKNIVQKDSNNTGRQT